MRISSAINSRIDPAPCRGARRLLAVAIGTSLLVGLIVAADLSLRVSQQGEDVGRWMQLLTQSKPALHPAGSPGRHPETIHPAVDLRFAAGLENTP